MNLEHFRLLSLMAERNCEEAWDEEISNSKRVELTHLRLAFYDYKSLTNVLRCEELVKQCFSFMKEHNDPVIKNIMRETVALASAMSLFLKTL